MFCYNFVVNIQFRPENPREFMGKCSKISVFLKCRLWTRIRKIIHKIFVDFHGSISWEIKEKPISKIF